MAAAAVLSPVGPAAALSCVGFEGQKPYSSFYGTAIQKDGSQYVFEVVEVWKGPDLARRTNITYESIWSDPPPAVGQSYAVNIDAEGVANNCTIVDGNVFTGRPAEVRQPIDASWWAAARWMFSRLFR